MSDNIRLPQQVVIRQLDYTFEIDGQPFPWLISQRGPVVVKISPQLWTIDIEILQTHNFRLDENTLFGWPVLDGHHFPWPITEAGFDLHCRYGQLCALRLSFFARNVDTDIEVITRNAEWSRAKKVGLDGTIYQAGD